MSLRNLSEAEVEKNDPPEPVNWPLRIVKITLGGIGIGAGALYLGPAELCSMNPACGVWFSDLITQQGAKIVFALEGVDFSAGAGLMGYLSAEAIIRYLKAQATLTKKVGKGGLVLVFTLTQNVSLLLTAWRTSKEPWQIPLSVLGNIPATTFGTIHYLETEIPYFISKLQELGRYIKWDSTSQLTPSELEEMRMSIHYQQQQALFLRSVNAKWRYIESNAEKLVETVDFRNNKLTFLFNQPEKAETTSELVTRYAGDVFGMLLALNFTAGGVSNSANMVGRLLRKIMPVVAAIPLQAVSALFVNASVFYGNLKYATKGAAAFLDVGLDIIRGVPIRSAMYRLSPKLTAAAAVFSVSISPLSYAVIAMLFINEFHADKESGNKTLDAVKQAFLINAMLGIIIYHIASVFHLLRLVFKSLTPDAQVRFILELEEEVERLNKMPLDEFKIFVQTNAREVNQHFNITEYTQLPENDYIAKDTVNMEKNDIIEIEGAEDNDVITDDDGLVKAAKRPSQSEQKNTSWTGSFCNFFSCCWKKTPEKKPVSEYTPLRLG